MKIGANGLRLKRAYFIKLGKRKKEIVSNGVINFLTHDTIEIVHKKESVKVGIKNVEHFKDYYSKENNERI